MRQLQAISTRFAGDVDEQSLLREALATAIRITGADSGAIRLVEALCRKGVPAFLSEHASDPIVPPEMPFLAKGIETDGWPREIRLTAHSEYTIRFSHLEQVARALGRKVETGSLLEWVGYDNAQKARFIFSARACSTDEQALTFEFLDHVREYRWLIVR